MTDWTSAVLNYTADYSPLWITAVFTICYQLLFFFIAYFNRFDKVTDLAGSSNFLINALISFLMFPINGQSSQKIVVTVCVCVWAIRLAVFLLIRVIKAGDDKRFDEMRSKFWSFLGFWVFQMLWVWLVGLSVVLMNSGTDVQYQFGTAAGDVVGLIMFVVGLVIEAVADQQRFHFRFVQSPAFKAQHKDDGKQIPVMKSGVWRYSRQPNYFGEILLWWGVFVMALDHDPTGRPLTYVSLISPIFITLLLLFLSGMPLAEAGAQKRYLSEQCKDEEAKKDYLEYRRTTSPLVPLPNGIYAKLPLWFKRAFLFEFKLYESKYIRSSD